MSTNIKVLVRVRPVLSSEEEEKENRISIDTNNNIITVDNRNFVFNEVSPIHSTQEYMFETAGKPIVDAALNGYNGTIFAYGQTGSGKTYTMNALMNHAIKQIFYKIDQQNTNKNTEFQIKVSCKEIYNKKIRDLAIPSTASSLSECIQFLELATKHRQVANTNMNEHSSRSHLIFEMCINRRQISNQSVEEVWSKLNFVDLAGSENQKRSGSTGQRQREARNINQSLLALGVVIRQLNSEIDRSRISWRESPLTHTLKDSLGGNSNTLMIACVSPLAENINQTLSTLSFATDISKIKNNQKKNQRVRMSLEDLKAENSKFVTEIEKLTKLLADKEMASKRDMQNLRVMNELRMKAKDSEIERLTKKIDMLQPALQPLPMNHGQAMDEHEENFVTEHCANIRNWKVTNEQEMKSKDAEIERLEQKLNEYENSDQAINEAEFDETSEDDYNVESEVQKIINGEWDYDDFEEQKWELFDEEQWKELQDIIFCKILEFGTNPYSNKIIEDFWNKLLNKRPAKATRAMRKHKHLKVVGKLADETLVKLINSDKIRGSNSEFLQKEIDERIRMMALSRAHMHKKIHYKRTLVLLQRSDETHLGHQQKKKIVDKAWKVYTEQLKQRGANLFNF